MASTSHVELEAGRTNRLAVVSVVVAVLALAGMLGLGTVVPAAFAVGAGHVALRQLREHGGRGRRLALVGLVGGYAVATWGLALTVSYLPGALRAYL